MISTNVAVFGLCFLLFAEFSVNVYSLLSPHSLQPSVNSVIEVNSKSEQECDSCQRVLYMTFVWYQRAESRRMLRHKLKHICKRYFEYRRHCLTALLPKIALIADRMNTAIYSDGHYKPIRTCVLLKECSKNQASLDADEMRSLRSLAINETSSIESDKHEVDIGQNITLNTR